MSEDSAGSIASGSNPVFLDTNILVASADHHDPDRQQLCRAHLRALQQTGRAVISTQVLQEFYVVATRKLGILPEQVRELVARFRRLPIVTVTPDLIEQAIDCHQADIISFWDALIVTAASSAGCTALLSADLNAGQTIRGVRVVDPETAEGL